MTCMAKLFGLAMLAILTAGPIPESCQGDDWPGWRGPLGNGIAPGSPAPPVQFGPEQSVIWKSPIVGRGHSSPTIVDNRIFLTTARDTDETQSVLCYARDTGKLLWETVVNRGDFNPRIHPSNTHASPTIVTCAGRLFATFNNHRGAQLVCLDFDGKLIWEKQAGRFIPQQYQFGYGASPIVFEKTVIVSSESEEDGFIAAFDQADGSEVWRTKRLGATSYSTPSIIPLDGIPTLVLSGGKNISGYDVRTGKSLWSIEAPWLVTCGTPVWEGNLIVCSGGFPANRTMAIEVQGQSVNMKWENAHRCYEQSLLIHEGYVYALTDQGRCVCLRLRDGQEMWNERLSSPVSASPVLAGGNLYFADERGNHYVVAADPNAFRVVQKNRLGDSSYATPTILQNRIYTRVGFKTEEGLQEWLYCFGQD